MLALLLLHQLLQSGLIYRDQLCIPPIHLRQHLQTYTNLPKDTWAAISYLRCQAYITRWQPCIVCHAIRLLHGVMSQKFRQGESQDKPAPMHA